MELDAAGDGSTLRATGFGAADDDLVHAAQRIPRPSRGRSVAFEHDEEMRLETGGFERARCSRFLESLCLLVGHGAVLGDATFAAGRRWG
jgi:hypothetical protein